MVERRNIDTVATITGGTINSVGAVTSGTINVLEQITSTVDVKTVDHYHYAAALFSSTVVAAGGTATSDWVDVKGFDVKTLSLVATSASTMIIQVAPTSSTATPRSYYTDSNIASDAFTTKSFTEAFYYARIQVTPSANNSTINAWIGARA